ncbi:MAG: AMP-binding protein [Candidatus Helarchaeota archaeon]
MISKKTVIKGKGKITTKKSGNGGYTSTWIYIPSKIANDSSFPFGNREEVLIEIKEGKIMISKIEKIMALINDYGVRNATLPKVIEKKAKENKDLPFFYFNGKPYSYMDTNRFSNQIAHGLIKLTKENRLRKSKIAIMCPNCPEFVFLWIGIVKTGCVFVPINVHLKGDLLKYILDNCDAEIIIIDYQYLDEYKKVHSDLNKVKKVIVINAPDNFETNDIFLKYEDVKTSITENPESKVKDFHMMEIMYTSGTTGRPKGIVYRNYFVLAGLVVAKELEEIGFNQNDRIYCPLPMFHSFAQLLSLLPALFMNASVVLTDKFHVSTFWDDVRKYKATIICYVGGILPMIMKAPPTENDRNHSVRFAFGGGAPIEVWKTFEKRYNIPIYEGWSMSEAVGITINKRGSAGGKIGSIGKSISGFEIKIVDKNGNELPPGPKNVGEIISRSSLPFSLEYYKMPDETDKKKDKDGWVRTGDLGYKDEDGYIYFVGRVKDMIRRRGENISAYEIERIANAYPTVLESAAFGVPNVELYDEDVKIVIVPKEGAEITMVDFHKYLSDNLPYFMVPRYIEIKNSLPKTATERIKKFIMRDEWNSDEIKRATWDSQIQDFILK